MPEKKYERGSEGVFGGFTDGITLEKCNVLLRSALTYRANLRTQGLSGTQKPLRKKRDYAVPESAEYPLYASFRGAVPASRL